MTRTTISAVVAALLAAATAAVIIVAMSGPSAATPSGEIDPAAVSDAVHDAMLSVFPAAQPGTPPPASADGVGAFDPETATWHLRTRGGDPTVFSFGTPGAVPLMGDWNGDGIDTVGTYDPNTSIVSLRHTNSAGPVDVTFTLGLPGDAVIAGDFDGDGTDTVSVVRPSDGFVLVYDTIGADLGDPAATYTPAGTGGTIVAADFNGDGTDTIGSWDPATGVITISTPGGALDSEVTATIEGDRFFTGDWTGDGTETPGMFAPATATVHLRYSNTTGGADESYPWGESSWIPVSGHFGDLASNVTVDLNGAPQGLAWAVESLYLELDDAPYYEGADDQSFTPASITDELGVEGIATTSEAFGSQVAVVKTDTDTILAITDDGWTWRIVGGTLASRDFTATASSPRFVLFIGSDWSKNADGTMPTSPLVTYADSLHIYSVNPAGNEGAIVGIPRDTAMAYTGAGNVDGMQKVNRTMRDTGPQVPTQVIANETGLPLEGYILTGFGSRITGFPGFEDVVDAMGGVDFLVPYSVPSQCYANPGTPTATEGDTLIDGIGALSFSRERTCIPTDDSGAPIRNGNVIRTLSQGLLMKAAVAQVQALGISAMPGLLNIMDDYTTTDLSAERVLTLAATIYDIDPGPMPTLTPSDIDKYGADAYNLNPGDLPNVVVEGCTGLFDEPADYAQYFVDGNYATFNDVADGTLNKLPVYEYNSGDPDFPLACPWMLSSSVSRLAGVNRYATAAVISQSKFAPGVAVVYVATGKNFPDALAAGPVATLNKGPILLVDPAGIPTETSAELSRLKPKRIVVVGGTAAVSASVESQLNGYTAGSVTRLAGSNRYGTAAEISASKFAPNAPVAYIATGLNFPDALAGGPVAALNGGPILLVEPNAIPPATAAELLRLAPGRIGIVGGTAAVSASVQSQLAAYTTGSVTRLAASDRFATAAEISKSKFSPPISIVYIATGRNFPDALAGGPVAGINENPILLVEQNSIPWSTKAELTRLQPSRIVILGGSAVVSNGVQAELEKYSAP